MVHVVAAVLLEPGALLQSIRSELRALEPAVDDLEKLDVLLEVRGLKEQLEAEGADIEELLTAELRNVTAWVPTARPASDKDFLTTVKEKAEAAAAAATAGPRVIPLSVLRWSEVNP